MRSVGKLIYSPKTHLSSSEEWAVLMCDEELVKYYSTLFKKQFPWLPKLQRPVWGAHISIIRGEKIINPDFWGLHDKKYFDFDYEPGVISNGEYYWLKVKCDALLDLREIYGLNRELKFGLHLTIARSAEIKK